MIINRSICNESVDSSLIEGLSSKRIYLSLLKSMVTTGILYQPYSFYLGGSIYSSVLCVIVAYLTLVCMIWLSKANDQLGGTYSDIAEYAMGPAGAYLLDSIIFITQFGPGMINIGFIIGLILRSFSIFNLSVSVFVISASLLLVLIPLCLIRSIQDQSWAHVIADVIIVSSIMIIAIFSLTQTSSVKTSVINPTNMIYTLGTLVYGFEGIPLILPIKQVMKNPKDFTESLTFMISTITVIFISFSAICCSAYGDETKVLVILNLPNTYWVAIILIMYSVAVILTMPLVLNPVFTVSEKHLKISEKKKTLNRILIILIIVVLGTLARDNLGFYVSVIGGVFSSPLAFIFPAFIHLKLSDGNREKKMAMAMIVTGVFFGVAAIFSTVYFSI